MTLDGEDEVRAAEVATVVDQEPIADLSSCDDVDRLLQCGHAGVLGRGDPFDFLRSFDAAPLLIDVGQWPHVDVAVAQVVGEHRWKVGIDIHRGETVLATDRLHQRRPAVVFVATGARCRDAQLEDAANLTDRCLLACATLLEGTRPEHGVIAAAVDHHDRVRHKESRAIEDVRVVIRLTEEQYGTVVTHVAERTSQVSRSRRERGAGATQPWRRHRMVRGRVRGCHRVLRPRGVDPSTGCGVEPEGFAR